MFGNRSNRGGRYTNQTSGRQYGGRFQSQSLHHRGQGGYDHRDRGQEFRGDRLSEPFFFRYCKEGANKRISTAREALEFLKSAANHEEKADTLNRLSTIEGQKAVKDMINAIDYDSQANFIASFFAFLFSQELAVGLKRNMALKLGTIIFDCTGFVDALVSSINKGLFEGFELRHVALFVSNVLSHENASTNDQEEINSRKANAKWLLKALELNGDEVVRNMLKNNMLTTSETLASYEPKHDNDVPLNFKDIEILPTIGELSVVDQCECTYRGWLGEGDALHAQALDRQFRLLRDDFVSPLKAERDEIFAGGSRRLRYGYPKVIGACLEERSTRGPCLNVEFQLPENLVRRFEKLTAREIEKFLEEEGNRILAKDSIVLFFDNHHAIISIGIIAVRDCEAMTKQLVAGRKVKENEKEHENKGKEETNAKKASDTKSIGPVSPSVTIGVWFRDETMIQLLANASLNRWFAHFAVVAKSSFFSYEPILNRLQDMNEILFEKELVSTDPKPNRISTIVKMPEKIATKLESDPSQMEAAVSALNQRVTLIQGPPGTGKTYVGVQLVRALLQLNPETKIMCLCFTNHALDSFLESLIDAGIATKSICRLGSATKISESIQECSLNKDEFAKFSRSQFILHQSYQQKESDYMNTLAKIGRDLQFSFTGGSWPHVKYSMENIAPDEFSDVFKQFSVQNASDGMQIVGRNNKAVDEKSGWRAWYDGHPKPTWIQASHATTDLWKLNRDDRRQLVREWSARANEHKAKEMVKTFHRYNETKRNHDALREESKVSALQRRSILAATTTFAAKNRNLLDSFQADVLIVEEAAEILEAHILTNLSPSMEKLIMIGDHLQLRPKVEHYPLRVESGRGIDFDRSLFERLIGAGYPYSTLSVQHRMRPEISHFIKGTYPALKDHRSTQGRDHIKGVSADVVFIDHRELEQNQGDEEVIETSSKVNMFEVRMIMKMLTYLIQQGYTGKDIVVLTPYLGQMMALRQELRRHSHLFQVVMGELDKEQATKASGDMEEDDDNSDNDKDVDDKKAKADLARNHAIRIATVDNFQGEEAKIIIASLVRSNNNRDIGFVSGAERVNVLFSRARDGFFILGNAETFENARSGRGRELWKTLLLKLRAAGCVYSGFPIKCSVHGAEQIVATPEEFDAKCPEGGCAQGCDEILPSCPLKHHCQRKCHPNVSHSTIKCIARLAEKCPRGLHDVERICSNPHVRCVGKHLFKCAAGHACFDECHLQNIDICNRCKTLQETKRKEEERLQAEIERCVRETEELERKHELQIAKLEAQERIGDERAKQRAIQENLEATNRKSEALKNLLLMDKSVDVDLSVNRPPMNADKALPEGKRAVQNGITSIQVDLDQELSFLTKIQSESKNSKAADSTIENKERFTSSRDLRKEKEIIIEQQSDTTTSVKTSSRPLPPKSDKDKKPNQTKSHDVEDSNSLAKVAPHQNISRNNMSHKKASIHADQPAAVLKTDDENFDFTNKIINMIGNDQFVDVIEAIKSKYPSVASIEVLTDVTRDINRDFDCIDHSLIFLLAQTLLGLESVKSIKAIQKLHDQCIAGRKSKDLTVASSAVLYEFVAAMVYSKNLALLQKAQEHAKAFLRSASEVSMRVVIPNSWIRCAESILLTIKDKKEKEEASIQLPVMTVDAKWKKIVSQQPTKQSPSLAMDAALQLSALPTVKEKFLEIYDSITLAKEQGRDLTASNFNSLFYGNPGTGKTTVAQLFAQFLIDMKLLPNECEILKKTGSELINGGVNELKTALEEMRDEHGGGVVFVDEAYQLDSNEGHRILDFILGHSEKFKGEFGKLVWIFAGYTKNMEKLLEHNVGLPSRFPNKFTFEDYEDNELLSIFHGLMKRRGGDIVSLVKGLTVKFKSNSKRGNSVSQPVPISRSGKLASNPYGIPLQRADETDEWGNLWRWDEANYTFVDAYGNTTGYGTKGLGSSSNPLISRKDGTPWLFDRANKRWYDQNNPARLSKTYPGKPFEESLDERSGTPRPLTSSFFATDEKWVRIAITRLGRLRGVKGFGNARAVRNLFDLCCKRQTNRIADLKRAGYTPDILQFTRDDLLGPKASLDSLRKSCPAYQELQELEGLKEVKQSVELFLKLVVSNSEREEHEEKPLEVALNRIFLGNPGTGKTTVAKLYADILKHLGLLSKGDVIYKTCSDFIGSVLGKSEEITRGILEQAKGCVLVIDEAYGLYQSMGTGVGGGNEPYREAVINTLVEQIQGKPGEDRAVLLLGYKEEMERMLAKANPGLARRFQLENAFQFFDYDDEALLTILKKRVTSEGLHISEDTAQFALKQLAKARARPHFGNAGAVDNLLSAAKLRMQSRMDDSISAISSILRKEDFVPEDYTEEVISEEDLFSELVGNKEIKTKLKRYRNLVEMKRQQNKDVKSVLPFTYIFTGSPGTGKTTVARLMGKMLCSLGIIPSDEVIEKSASDFQTGFVGQSGKQTRDIFQQALGRVLFIDEAYQLNPQVGGNYMSEVVDEIVKLLTSKEYKGKLVVILAGYQQDIDEMLRVNQGLKSRFTERIHFEDFDEETVFEMLCRKVEKMANESSTAAISGEDNAFPEECRNHLGMIANQLKQLPDFANGRDIETYVSKLEIAIADQFAETGSDAVTIESLDASFQEFSKLKGEHLPSISSLRHRQVTDPFPHRPAFQSSFRQPPPPPAISTAAASDKHQDKKEDGHEKSKMVGVADEKDQFLAELQSELDRLGFNSAEGVARVSTLPPDHPQLLQLAQSIAVSCGIDLAMVKNLLKKWSGDQATVRDEIRKQIEEEEKAKVEQREAMVPIWRCAVCGRADQPFIACYVQPYVVRYEKRRLK